jgi:putative MATE family efflux protein
LVRIVEFGFENRSMHAPSRPSANPLLTAPILPTVLRMSLPNMAALTATAAVAIAETAYVGRLGTAQLAGMALVFPMVMLQQMLSSGAMGGGVSSAISRALGAGDERRAAALAFHAVIIGSTLGLCFSALFLVFGRDIFTALGGRGAPLEEALAYARVVFAGIAGLWLTNTLVSVVRGGGNMRVPSATLFTVAAAQVVIGGTLGLGFGPIPRLGMTGIALGQTLAFAGGALFLLVFLLSGRARVRLSLDVSSLRWEMFGDILKVGVIACLSPLQTVATVLILTALVARFGPEALAGYGIGARLEFLLIPITFAIGVACVPLVGMAIGAGDVTRARRVAWTGGALSAALLGGLGLVAALVPDLWARLFASDPSVLAATRLYLVWSGPFYAFLGLGLCLYFASQGAGKVLGPVLAGTVRLAVIALGGLALSGPDVPLWQMFALVGAAMAMYGIGTAMAVWLVPWGRR